MADLKNSKPRLEFFPDSKHIDEDIPGIHEILDADGEIYEGENKFSDVKVNDINSKVMCQEFGVQGLTEVIADSVTAQGEFKRFMKYQEAGLDSSYKCPKCRSCDDCIKGSGYQRISLKQEAEQV